MQNWFEPEEINNEDEISSLVAPKKPAQKEVLKPVKPVIEKTYSQPEEIFPAPPLPTKPVIEEAPEDAPKEAITQIGNTYEIKNVVTSQKKTTPARAGMPNIPNFLIAVLIIAPLIFIFVLSAFFNKQSKEKKDDSFLFRTLESKYFTMNYDPSYEIESIVDKRVPFIEKHTLISQLNGEKTLNIVIKDIKFDYKIEENSAVIARRGNSNMYEEKPIELRSKQGFYFKKKEDNFEHMVVLIDRSKSLLYEILFYSPSNFAGSQDLEKELQNFLDSITFL